MGAGLPDFRGLVEHCYGELGAVLPPRKSGDWNWLDRMLGSLENEFPTRMRATVVNRLNIPATDLTMHKAILRLARLRGPSGSIRLVTTNFDLLFEQAQNGMALGVHYHSAPVLPIPRNDQMTSWRSIVYLHGRLDAAGTDNQHLVLTSADFGRAYLTDAWGARFVARLFTEFTVLFIGYSLNDPVLRYMTDAFAAEDALSRSGRKRSPAYIFVPYSGKPPNPKPWRVRRLEPIFYREAYQHRALKKTLIEWANARQNYLASVRQIIQRGAPRLPSALQPSDTANVLWAVCDRSGDGGHGARVFAAVSPAPPIEWLFEFERRDEEARARHEEEVLLAKREGREAVAPPIYHIESLFPSRLDNRAFTFSEPTSELVPWLMAHLENQQLVNWTIAKHRAGRRPHQLLRLSIRQRLDRAPPLAAGYAAFWRLMSSEGEWMAGHSLLPTAPDLQHAILSGLEMPWLEQEIRAALHPHLDLATSYRSTGNGARFQDIADAEVRLRVEGFGFIDRIDTWAGADAWCAARLDMLTQLLRQVLDLYATVGEADATIDPSAFQRPSIQPHPQNKHHAEWAKFYDLLWRGWTRLDAINPEASRFWIERWRKIPYLGFRRFVLAAVAHSSHFASGEKLEILLDG